MPPKAAGFPLGTGTRTGTGTGTGNPGVGLGQVSYVLAACQGLVVIAISGRILCLWHLEIGSASSPLLLLHLLYLLLFLHFPLSDSLALLCCIRTEKCLDSRLVFLLLPTRDLQHNWCRFFIDEDFLRFSKTFLEFRKETPLMSHS